MTIIIWLLLCLFRGAQSSDNIVAVSNKYVNDTNIQALNKNQVTCKAIRRIYAHLAASAISLIADIEGDYAYYQYECTNYNICDLNMVCGTNGQYLNSLIHVYDEWLRYVKYCCSELKKKRVCNKFAIAKAALSNYINVYNSYCS